MALDRRAVIMATATASLGLASLAPKAARGGESWPSRPLRCVVPYPPGGPTDILARVVLQRVAQILGQPVIIDNRAGASGVIGSGEVARAAPDGQTFLANASIHTIIPHLSRNMPFDTLADFAPVTNIARVPLILVVHPRLPIHSVADLVTQLRAGGRFSYGSSGIGAAPHLAGELFKQMTGTEMVHVPYRGSGPALQDLIAGNIQLMFDSMTSSADLVRAKQIRALAVTTAGRAPTFPDLPTIAEAGVPGYEISTWYGLWAPARTPAEIVLRMQKAVAEAVAEPTTIATLDTYGAEPVADSPAAFAAFVRAEFERWGKLVREAGIETQ